MGEGVEYESLSSFIVRDGGQQVSHGFQKGTMTVKWKGGFGEDWLLWAC